MFSVLTLQRRIDVLEHLILDLKKELNEKDKLIKSKL